MGHTIRERRALRALSEIRPTQDESNFTLRFNRTMKDAGMFGPLEGDDHPSIGAWVGMLGAATAGVIVMGLFFVLVLH